MANLPSGSVTQGKMYTNYSLPEYAVALKARTIQTMYQARSRIPIVTYSAWEYTGVAHYSDNGTPIFKDSIYKIKRLVK